MELITILATIILIATISTFILSIGAYILYKIRNRRESKPIYQSVGRTKAELVTVNEQENWEELRQKSGRINLSRVQIDDLQRESDKTEKRKLDNLEKNKHQKSASLKYIKYDTEGRPASDKDRTAGDLQWK